jgi:hypothetical protein
MDITTEIIDAFRAAYPEFSDVPTWPLNQVTKALCEGDVETGSTKRWGGYVDDCHNFKQRGMFLFAAHWLASTYPNGAADPAVVNPAARLNISGQSVGDESIQFRITEIQSTGDDWLSTTIYGTQFLRLRRRAGMGAMAV